MHCTSARPPYRDRAAAIPANIDGSYSFKPAVQLFHESLRGEIVFDPILAPIPKTNFKMRIIGRTKQGSIRMRSYDGTAVVTDRFLELRADRCYLFGKRDWEDRMVPLERWDCDHLVFQFERTRDRLRPFRSAQSRRTSGSDWFGIIELVPLPLSAEPEAAFAGQILADLDETRTIVWGSRADRQLRNGQKLRAEDETGRYAGTLIIESRPGDFAISRWAQRAAGVKAQIAWTSERIRDVRPFE